MLTFKEWIVRFKGVDLPIGELAKDIDRDKRFPNSIIYNEILDYLEYEVYASSSVLDNFDRVYNYYLESIEVPYSVK